MNPKINAINLDEHVIKLTESGIVSIRSGCVVTI